jgi:hypothetical protein
VTLQKPTLQQLRKITRQIRINGTLEYTPDTQVNCLARLVCTYISSNQVMACTYEMEGSEEVHIHQWWWY